MSRLVGQQVFEVGLWDTGTAQWNAAGSEPRQFPLYLPKGAIWHIDKFIISANTKYAAADTNYNVFHLKDSATGNIIGGVRNGPAASGLDINIKFASTDGVQSAFTAAYQEIDCRTADGYLVVTADFVGTTRAMTGLKAYVVATPRRG